MCSTGPTRGHPRQRFVATPTAVAAMAAGAGASAALEVVGQEAVMEMEEGEGAVTVKEAAARVTEDLPGSSVAVVVDKVAATAATVDEGVDLAVDLVQPRTSP
jgi:hypothetical protein